MPQVLLVPIVDFSTTQSLAPPTPHFDTLVYTVLKYFQAFETHPPHSVYFSLHGTKILSTILHPPPLGRYFSLHGTKMKFDQKGPTHGY